MKKIIATVLAMVMALALCTTAFADIPLWTENGSTTNVDLFDGKLNTKTTSGAMTFHAAVAPTVDSNGKVTAAGNVAYYTFKSAENFDGSLDTQKFILVSSIPADADASQYVLVKTADATIAVGAGVQTSQSAANQTLIMKKVTAVTYGQTATVFTGWGDLCGQYKKPTNADEVTYVSFNNVFADKAAQVWGTLSAAGQTPNDTEWKNNVLVNGEVYTVNGQQTAKAHSWGASAWDKKGVATEYTCATCKTVAKVINASVNAPAGSTVEKIGNVMRHVPGTCIRVAFVPEGAAAHSQEYLDAGKTEAAHNAVVYGAKILALTGAQLIENPEKLEAIKKEFHENLAKELHGQS